MVAAAATLLLQDKFQTHPFIQQIFVENKLWAGTWRVQGGEEERLLKYPTSQAAPQDSVLRALKVEKAGMEGAQKRRELRHPGAGMAKDGFLQE